MVKKPCPLLCALAIELWAASGRADAPPAPRVMRLEYVRGPDAQGCPEAKVFRDAVTMGYHLEPFDDSATARMRVTISSIHSQYQASIEVRGGDGGVIWTREMRPRARCETLVRNAGSEVHRWLRETFPIEAAPPPPLPPPLPHFLRLEYVYPSYSHCPSAQTLQDLISDIMSYDPFVQTADARLAVTIRRDKRTYRGHAEVQDGAGKVLWSFDLDGVGCLRVASGLSLTIGVMLEPPAPPKPEKPPSPPPPPLKHAEPLPPIVVPEAVDPPSPPPLRWPRFSLGLGGAVATRTAEPLLAGELVADAELRFRVATVAGEFRWTLPASIEPGQASVTQLTGGIIPCRYFTAFFLCGVAQVGAVVRMPSQSITSPFDAGVMAAAGARIGKDWPASERFAVRLSADLLASFPLAALYYDDTPVRWTTAGITLGLGAGVVMNW